MKKVLFLFSIVIISCSNPSVQIDEYSSIIDNLLRFKLNDVDMIVIEARNTEIDSIETDDTDYHFSVPPSLLRLILERNKISHSDFNFMSKDVDKSTYNLDTTQFDIMCMHQDTISRVFTKYKKDIDDAYSYLYEKYQVHEYAIVSKPIFNKERDIVLFYVDTHCGSLCGTGYLFFMVKKKNKWRIEVETQTWES